MKVGDEVYIIKENKFNHGTVSELTRAFKEETKHKIYQISGKTFYITFGATYYSLDETEISLKKESLEDRLKAIKREYFRTIRSFLKENKDKLQDIIATDYNYITINGYAELAVCCSLTKNLSKINVYVPKRYLELFARDEKFLKTWVQFIKNLGFNCEYKGFIKKPNIKKEDISKEGNLYRYGVKRDFYHVTIDNNSSYINYFNFILLRYAYNHLYWQIPADILEIRETVKEATDFQCVLMAHYVKNYHCGYALIDVDNYEMIDIFKSTLEVVKKNVQTNHNMNGSYVFTKKVNWRNAKAFAEKREWQALYDYLKENS